MTYSTLRVDRGADQGLISAGDEPVLYVAQVKVTIGRPGSLIWRWVNASPGEWVNSGVANGSTVTIPPEYGRVSFAGDYRLEPINPLQVIVPGNILKMDVGISVVIALDSNFSSAGQNTAFLNSIMEPTMQGLAAHLDSIPIPLHPGIIFDPTPLSSALAEIESGMDAALSENLSYLRLVGAFGQRGMSSAGNADDIIGIGVTALVPIDSGWELVPRVLGVTPESLGMNSDWTRVHTKDKDLGLLGHLRIPIWAGFVSDKKVTQDLPLQGILTTNDWIITNMNQYTLGVTAQLG